LASSCTRSGGCAVAVNGGLLARDPLIPPSFPLVPTLAEIQIVYKGFRSR
jgi:hypothetical protein